MNPSRPPRSVKVLASNRRQIKSSVQRMLTRLSELEEGQQLSCMPEIRVFAKNIERFYGELDKVLQEMEASNPSADQRDAHDLEYAEIVGLLQEANQRIVALCSTLLSYPVEAASSEQCQYQPCLLHDVEPALLSTNKSRREGECTRDADAEVKVCVQIQTISSPPIPTKLQEMTPNLSCPESMPISPQHPKRSLKEHQEMQPPTEPEAVQEEASPTVRGETDETVGPKAVPTPRTAEWTQGELDVGTRQSVKPISLLPAPGDLEVDATSGDSEELPDCELDVGLCQSVELGSLLPADNERDDANSNDTNPETAVLVDGEPDTDKIQTTKSATNQAVMDDQARSLLPTDSEDRSHPCCAQTPCAPPAVQEDFAEKANKRTAEKQSKRPTSKNSDTSGNRSRADREAAHRKAVEELPYPVISSSIAQKPRLVWDPGVVLKSEFSSTIAAKTTTR